MRFLMSRISGMLEILTSSEVRSTALMTCRASFLAPCGTISPLSFRPPSIVNVDIGDRLYVFDFRVEFHAEFILNCSDDLAFKGKDVFGSGLPGEVDDDEGLLFIDGRVTEPEAL